MNDDHENLDLPKELTDFKSKGFSSLKEYVISALLHYTSAENQEIRITAEILDQIGVQIDRIENNVILPKDDSPNKVKEHLKALYMAAEELASSRAMLDSELNYDELPNGKSSYKYKWALFMKPDMFHTD